MSSEQTNSNEKSLDDQLKEAELKRLEEETKRIEEERYRIRVEREELEKGHNLPWFKSRYFFGILQAIVAGIIFTSVIWVFMKDAWEYSFKTDNLKLAYQNELAVNSLRKSKEELKRNSDDLFALQKRYDSDVSNFEKESEQLKNRQKKYLADLKILQQAQEKLAKDYKRLQTKQSLTKQERDSYQNKYNQLRLSVKKQKSNIRSFAKQLEEPYKGLFSLRQFVKISSGSFKMGSNSGSDDEKPVHSVRISRSFYMGKYEVTQEQWEAVMGNNPSKFKGKKNPVENVSWNGIQEFIKRLNEKYGRKTFRLPTEAEWEYACRAGTKGKYAGDLDQMGWYGNNSGNKTHPVGQKKPNSWGLYDMHGNVWEWCSDWYDADYYSKSPEVDPQGFQSGSYRVLRGGGWDSAALYCRSAIRYGGSPGIRDGGRGFRLMRF